MTGTTAGTSTDAAARPRRRRASAFTAAIAAIALLVTGSIAVTERPAFAIDYPSWNDVVEARRNVASAQAQIAQIQAAITAISAEVERTEAISREKGTLFFEAQQAFDEAAFTADELQAQADAAQVRADESRSRAGQFVAELARSGGGDLSASLFTNPGNADDLLSRLGFASKISEQADGIYASALQDQNAAQALTDQATIAREIREQLRIEAEIALAEAQVAAEAAQVALTAQLDNQARLQAQLAVLVENREATEADYNAGVEARAAAARAAGVAGITAGQIANGWTVPASGWISSSFGYRIDPINGRQSYHSGTDIASNCGQPIFAASSGTVNYAGWYGNYGYFVRIDHGNGLTSSYGHIQQGGILVQMGQQIPVGAHIARIGTTGWSTGCHLHLEIRQNGIAGDPVQYLRSKGLTVG